VDPKDLMNGMTWENPQQSAARTNSEASITNFTLRSSGGLSCSSIVVAENRGDETAEGVYAEVLIKGNGKEERGMSVDRRPGKGKRRGVVTFETDPAWPAVWKYARSDRQSRSHSGPLAIDQRHH
jgi:hypothetical protein